jgi:hypothetical protein
MPGTTCRQSTEATTATPDTLSPCFATSWGKANNRLTSSKYPRDGFMAVANYQWRLMVWRRRGWRALAFAKGLLGGNVARYLSGTEVSEYKILFGARISHRD